jgi:hypothetical protein
MLIIDHDCEGSLPGGFFSKFLIVLDWIHNSIYQNEKVFVNWNCLGKLDHNIWDYLFEEPQLDYDETNRTINLFHYRFYHGEYVYHKIHEILPKYHDYGGKFWNNPKIFTDENFQTLRDEYNKAWSKIIVKEHVNENIQKYLNSFGNKTLGVTVRIPLHYTYNQPEDEDSISKRMSPEHYYEQIYQEIKNEFDSNEYDKILVACDVDYFIKLMVEKFGEEKIIFTNYKRVNGLDQDWVEKGLTFKEEYFLILSDALLLSKCDLIMGGSSNIFLGTLFINNQLKFKIFNILKETYGC